MQDISKNISGAAVRLREVIAKTGLSQAKFASLIDEDVQRLKDVLRGHMKMSGEMIEKIVKHAGVNATWLITGYQLAIGELSETEQIMVANFRLLHEVEQGVMVRAIVGLARAENERRQAAAAKTDGKTP